VWGLVDGATEESPDCQRLFCPLPKCRWPIRTCLDDLLRVTEGAEDRVGWGFFRVLGWELDGLVSSWFPAGVGCWLVSKETSLILSTGAGGGQH
jgi:hypothetical protein